MTHLKPEVKNASGDHTFADEAMRITLLAWEVLKKTRICTGTRTAARKKSDRRNAWGCRSLEIQDVPSGTNENAKKVMSGLRSAHIGFHEFYELE